LITGITGQDGSYLTEYLLSKGYIVHGLIRRASESHTQRIDHLRDARHDADSHLVLHYGDLADAGHLTALVYQTQPDEIYHLGAQSHVRVSFDVPDYTGEITGLGTLRLLEAVRRSGLKCSIYQASSSEMFGDAPAPQDEDTPFRPRSPYAIAKLYAYWLVRSYREGYGLAACNGIMFNHESPRRGEAFVSRKIAKAAAAILAGCQDKLLLGNLEARRDWGYAPEYVEAMWLMLQQDIARDLVFGTGEAHSVREFVEEAFAYIGLDWHDHVVTDHRCLRPTEVDALCANPHRAKQQLGWEARIHFRDLVRLMVDAELKALGRGVPSRPETFVNTWQPDWLKGV